MGWVVFLIPIPYPFDVDKAGGVKIVVCKGVVKPVVRVGAYKDQADMDSIRVIERNGLRIAVVAFTYGTNGYSPSGSVKIPYLTEETVKSQMEKAVAAGDFVMVVVHWGEENSYAVSDNQKKFASLFAECGADVIIGSHPHVIQPIEWIEKENGEKIPCVYSLGNLVSMMAEEYNMLGGVLSFDIVSKNGGHPCVENILFRPTVYYYRYSDWFGNKIYYLDKFTPELASSHGVQHYNNTLKLANMYKLAKRQIAEEYLPAYVTEYAG